jgi:hypothetical protein
MESKEEGAEEQAFGDACISIHFVKQTKMVGNARFERVRNRNLMLLWWLTFLTNAECRGTHSPSSFLAGDVRKRYDRRISASVVMRFCHRHLPSLPLTISCHHCGVRVAVAALIAIQMHLVSRWTDALLTVGYNGVFDTLFALELR